MNNARIFSIDLTVTANCNFNCTYCFEHEFFENKEFTNYKLFFSQIKLLLNSDFFKNTYDILGIGFWGGEPSLNPKAIKTIYEYYKNNDKIKFFIYSNGSNFEPIYNILEECKNKTLMGHPKFAVQVSYDGLPVHDIFRKTKQNRLTGNKTRNAIIDLWKNKIPTVIKSTITPEAFKYLPEARKDILSMYEEYPENDFFRSDNYFPTIDYYNIDKYTDKEIDIFKKELEKTLIKIAKEEIEYVKKNNKHFFSWFNPSKAICCAGKDMICINWDEKVYKCHGSVYEDESNEHQISNLKNPNFVDDIVKSNKLHSCDFAWEPEECKKCISTFCLRCNPVKYNNSKKLNYFEKWKDYTSQPKLCEFYKLNGKIVNAIKKLI